MVPSPILRALEPQPPLIPELYTSPYKAKRSWPPNFDKLTPKHQFRLERRYKRRVKLKWARPQWTKAVKIAQLLSVIGIGAYGVLFMDWKEDKENPPFQAIRKRVQDVKASMWTMPDRGQRREIPDNVSRASNTK